MKSLGALQNLALLLLSVLLLAGCSCTPAKVPDVGGMTLAEAQAALAEAGFTVGAVTQAHSPAVPAGSVISQTPGAGTAARPGSVVDLTQSLGPQPVPNVVGMVQLTGCTALISAGFKVGTITEAYSTTVDEGIVLAQLPEAGAAASPGDEVALTVSGGPPPVVTPDVAGQALSAASRIITDAGLNVGTVTHAYSATVVPGAVMAQEPEAGATAPYGSAVSLTLSKGPRFVKVPSVVGQTPEMAFTIFAGVMLTVGQVTQAYSVTVPLGRIVSQFPQAGASAESGTAVALVVSQGPRTIVVPDVVGMTQSAAVAVLAGVNLTVGAVSMEYSSVISAGSVVSQQPVAGTGAPEGSTVAIVLSRGPRPVVPDMVGMLLADAKTAIADARLALGAVTEDYSASTPAGRVVSQLPAAGMEADIGAKISLVLSKGPQPVVPNVVGLLPEEAETALGEARLVLGAVTEDYSRSIPLGRVAVQSPAAGTAVEPGAAVSLVVSKGPRPVTVPGVVGTLLEAASEAIVGADLVVGTVAYAYTSTVGTGRVISQIPAGGSSVLPGSAVNLTVSKGPRPVTVPNAVGQTQSTANALIAEAGMVPGAVTERYSDTVQAGLVMEQNPAAGQTALTGDAVDLVLSIGGEFIAVPAGKFTMGNTGAGDDKIYGQASELPAHEVTLSAYQIGRCEVTNGQYCDVLNWAMAQGFLKNQMGAAWTGSGDLYAGENRQIILSLTSTYCDIEYQNGVFAPKIRGGFPSPARYSMDRHPVVQVSWHGAAAYCNWRSQWQGLPPCYDMSAPDWPLLSAPPASGGFRLPTEAEWERAAAWDGGKHWIYGYSDDRFSWMTDANRCNFDVVNSEDEFHYANPRGLLSYPYTSPVGWFNGQNTSPNGNIRTANSVSPVGCRDMSGNVWEWCQDWYLDTYYSGGAMTDPTGPATRPAPGSTRVLRGGTVVMNYRYWGFPILSYLRTAARDNYYEISYAEMARDYVGFGFRLARTP